MQSCARPTLSCHPPPACRIRALQQRNAGVVSEKCTRSTDARERVRVRERGHDTASQFSCIFSWVEIASQSAGERAGVHTCRFERDAVTFRSDVTSHAVSRRFPQQRIYYTRIIRRARERELKVGARALGK